MKKQLENLVKDVKAHQQIISEMRKPYFLAAQTAKEIGAIGYSCPVGTGWMRFLMPDGKVKFGTVSYNGFNEEPLDSKWRAYFNVPLTGIIENYFTSYM
ncbi:MAG: hypothetical protein ABIF12_00685 [bacterium]